MNDSRPLTISTEGYVLVDCIELERLEAIESRAVCKLGQLKLAHAADDTDTRRSAHIEALAFVLATADAISQKGGN